MSSTPFSNAGLFTYIMLDGQRPPGIWRRSSGGDRTQQEQDQQAPGFAGAFTVFRFQDISKIEYRVTVTTPTGYQALEAFALKLNKGAAKRPPVTYKFIDPWLRANGIGVVAVLTVGPLEQPAPGVQRFEQSYKFTEYKRLTPIGGPVSPKPTTELEKLIAGQEAGNAALAAQLAALQAQAKKDSGG